MTGTERLTAAQFRRHFPLLEQKVYLASCSQGALSDGLSGALTEFQATLLELGNPWDVWVKRVECARAAFADLIGASAGEIAILSCASEGAYQVASGFEWSRRPGIVTTDREFPSVATVWLAQRRSGAVVRHARRTDDDLAEYDRLIGDATALVSVPLNTYIDGRRLPVREIADRAHAAGARVFVDAYQGLGTGPVDVTELDCDYLVCGALKYLLGVPGIAFLYVKNGVRQDFEPVLTGWFGQRETFGFDPRKLDFADDARRFQSGSPPVVAAYGAVAGMSMLGRTDPIDRARHIEGLAERLQGALIDAGEVIASPLDPTRRGPQIAVRDPDPAGLAEGLRRRGVITSPRGELVRIALHYYSSVSDVDACVDAFAEHRRGV